MDTSLPQYKSSETLEKFLGDPSLAENVFSYKAAMERDVGEIYAEQSVNLLNAFGLNYFYVPQELGGSLVSCEEALSLHRVVARRDVASAITYSTLGWSMLVWIAGDAEQKKKMAHHILHTAAAPCLAYSEKAHGADLLHGDVTAQDNGAGGYRLNGEKWPINRATRGDSVAVVARTGADYGTRSLSVFMVDKRDMKPATYYNLPRGSALGLRGLDLSGIGFKDAIVPHSCRIGKEGDGLEVALRALQFTRALCASFSLGAGDTLLRTTVDLGKERHLYGKAVVEIPLVREHLANAYLNLLTAEAIALIAARGFHLFPEQFSVWSGISKVQAPALVEKAAQAVSVVMGARFFMRDEYSIFQKAYRDNLVVNIFDGSSSVCLNGIGTQLKSLAIARGRGQFTKAQQVETLFDLRKPLPTFEPHRIQIFSRGLDAVPGSMPTLLEKLASIVPDANLSVETLADITAAAKSLSDQLAVFDRGVLAFFETSGDTTSPELFGKAEHYCCLHGAVASLGMWLYNRDYLRPAFAQGVWLLTTLLRQGSPDYKTGDLPAATREHLVTDLLERHAANELLSIVKIALAPTASANASR